MTPVWLLVFTLTSPFPTMFPIINMEQCKLILEIIDEEMPGHAGVCISRPQISVPT